MSGRVVAWLYGARGALWVIILSAIVPYSELRHHSFVHDDHDLRGPGSLVTDPAVDIPTLLSADLFGRPDQLHGHSGYWRPLVLWSFRVEHELTGGSVRATAWLGHMVNFILHALVCVALWCLLRALELPPPAALLAAVAFAVHPVHVEAVGWLVARSETLPPLFVWSAMAWTLAAKRAGGRHAALGVLACLAALLSKETAALLVGLWAPVMIASGRPWRQSVAVPAAALAVYATLRLSIFPGGVDPLGYAGPDDTLTRWLTWLSILPDQLRLSIWPGFESSPIHPVAEARGWGAPGVLAGALLLVAGLIASWWSWRRRHAVAILGVGAVVGTMVMVAPWARFPTGFAEVAAPLYERYLYVASLGPILALAWWLRHVLASRRIVALVVTLVVAVAGGLVVHERAETWQDDGTFARAALRAVPESPDLWNHLGYWHLSRFVATGSPTERDESLAAFDQAIAHDPQHRFARINRFLVLRRANSDEDALAAAADDLLRRYADDALVLDNVAGWHMERERWPEAAALLKRELGTGFALPGAADALAYCIDQMQAVNDG